MKKLESSLTNMVLVLTGVAVVMGGILAYVNHLTEGPIAEQKKLTLAQGIKTVMVSDNIVVAGDCYGIRQHCCCRPRRSQTKCRW